jgi:hypothetical protein
MNIERGSPDKAKPPVRRGQKAADAEFIEAWPSCRRINFGMLGFFLNDF